MAGEQPAGARRAPLTHARLHIDIALLLLRLIIGVVGVYHGSQKLFAWFGGKGIGSFVESLTQLGVPAPEVSAYLAGGAEFYGGILVAAGVLTRLAAIPFLVNMIVAVTVVHNKAFGLQHGGMEYALTLGVILLALVIAGGGRLTVMAPFRRPAVQTPARPGAEAAPRAPST